MQMYGIYTYTLSSKCVCASMYNIHSLYAVEYRIYFNGVIIIFYAYGLDCWIYMYIRLERENFSKIFHFTERLPAAAATEEEELVEEYTCTTNIAVFIHPILWKLCVFCAMLMRCDARKY